MNPWDCEVLIWEGQILPCIMDRTLQSNMQTATKCILRSKKFHSKGINILNDLQIIF